MSLATAPVQAVGERMLDTRSLRRVWALVRKEVLELRRDRRSLLLIVGMPVVLMLIFGYAASFDVRHLATELVGTNVAPVRAALARSSTFRVLPGSARTQAAARADLRDGTAQVAIVVAATGRPDLVLVDGSNLLAAQAAQRGLDALAGPAPTRLNVDVLYNPSLRSADFMVPGLVGIVMMQAGLVYTALAIARERERGTLEQLLITPITKLELMVGKVLPYLGRGLVDLAAVTLVGLVLFRVPLRGNLALLVLGAVAFFAAALGIGLLISTVAQTQQQATQLSLFVLLPQVLLSGWIFPVASIPWGVRWLCYCSPLTYFMPVSRGIFLKGTSLRVLWPDYTVLAGMAVVFIALAAARFRKQLG